MTPLFGDDSYDDEIVVKNEHFKQAASQASKKEEIEPLFGDDDY